MGIDSINDLTMRKKVLNLLKEHTKDLEYYNLLDNGISGVNIMKNLEPLSGFFLLLNFNELKGLQGDNITINNEFDLLKYFYKTIKLRYILGSGCLWPNKNDIIGRFTYAKPYEDLIEVSVLMDKSIKKLTK